MDETNPMSRRPHASLTAIIRAVSPSLGSCELSYLPRQRIDISKAVEQHRAYEQCLARLGLRVISLPHEAELPDAVFVEDGAIVVDEVAVITRMGVASRRPETDSLAAALSPYRRLHFLRAPATLEGGDVLRVGRTLYVGATGRTNCEGIAQLEEMLRPFDYRIKTVAVSGCLHLKTGCSYLGHNTLLANSDWIDISQMDGLEIIAVPGAEPWAANTLMIGETVLLPASFPQTRALLERRGFCVETLDISELQRAEAGLTCLSIVFESDQH
jgi:dimethylargininase